MNLYIRSNYDGIRYLLNIGFGKNNKYPNMKCFVTESTNEKKCREIIQVTKQFMTCLTFKNEIIKYDKNRKTECEACVKTSWYNTLCEKNTVCLISVIKNMYEDMLVSGTDNENIIDKMNRYYDSLKWYVCNEHIAYKILKEVE